jgi:cytochrome c553
MALMAPRAAAAEGGRPAGPENLALRAKATASSEFNAQYAARGACDGVIPEPGNQDDVGKAWAANGNLHPDGVWFTLDWAEPVQVAEVVYYARTGWVMNEGWKDYEVWLDAAPAAAVKGTLQCGHGPQRIRLPQPAAAVRRLRLKFLTSQGGPNPGASEIRVYAVSPPDAAVGKFHKASLEAPDGPVAPDIVESPALAARLKAGEMGFTKMVVVQRHHVRSSHVYTYHCEGQRDGGGLFVCDLTDGSMKQLVDSPDGQILGADLSFDGKTILFSWRRRPSPYYQVYRIGVDGSGLKQLTEGACFNYDAAWLPDGGIVFLSSRRPQAAYCFFTPVGTLYRMSADGTDQRRISANYLNDFTPSVTNDGRIIYGRWEYVDRPAIPIQSLWTINPDGTMLQGFFGNRVLDPATFIEPQAIPGSNAILCTMTGHNGSCRGAIGIIDPIHGENAQESIRNVTPEVRLRGVQHSSNGPQGPYQTPYPVDGRYFLVSYDGTILLRDYDATEQTIALAPHGLGFYNPRPVRPRVCPPIQTPRTEWMETATGQPWAAVYLQDVYNGLEGHVQRGEVKQIAVVQERARGLIDSPGIQNPAFDFQRVVVSCGATYVPKKVWGLATVRQDGSAYFKVPAGQPIYFMALDERGRAVQRMRSFTHLMPGEVQGCAGCHESRAERPLPKPRPAALAGEPEELTPTEWGTDGFSYAAIVQPVLDRHCVRCHDPVKAPKGIDLSGDYTDYFNVSYEVLARRNQGRKGSPYVAWIPTYNGHEWNILEITPKFWGSPASKLADMVLAGHPDADGKPRVKLPEPDLRRLLAWMDLNAPYYGTADTAYPEMRGCRRIVPKDLQKVMDDVYTRRCASCHEQKGHQVRHASWRAKGEINDPWVRITNPQHNEFLMAPLAKSAGGTERCGQPVFRDATDPDYRAVLATFEPVAKMLKDRPRMDMPGAVPAACCLAGKQ